MTSIATRTLGSSGLKVGAIGHGLMNLTWREGDDVSDEQAFKSMKAALNAGANLWNSGNFYGNPDQMGNIKLLRRYFDKYPEDADKVVLSVKGGFMGNIADEEWIRADVQKTIDALGSVKKIDIFENCRQTAPVEETLPILQKFVKEGLFSHIALSECGAATVRKAAAIAPIVAVEVECSLFAAEPELYEVVKACEELDIALIGYSPLGYGILAADWKTHDDIPEGNIARHRPKCSPENFPTNLKLVNAVKELAEKKDVTRAQLAIAWTLKLSEKVIPIPGSSSVERTLENLEAANITLTDAEFEALNEILKSFPTAGTRYGGPVNALNWA